MAFRQRGAYTFFPLERPCVDEYGGGQKGLCREPAILDVAAEMTDLSRDGLKKLPAHLLAAAAARCRIVDVCYSELPGLLRD